MNDNADMGVKRDIPISLNSITYEDNYAGRFTQDEQLSIL